MNIADEKTGRPDLINPAQAPATHHRNEDLPAPPAPRVPMHELEDRLAKIRRSMASEAVDCLIVTSKSTLEYLTDYRSLTWAYHSRPLFCLVTQGDFLLIASKTEQRNVESNSQRFQPVYYDGYLAAASDSVLQQVSTLCRRSEPRVAIDYGQDLFGRGALNLVQGLIAQGAVLSSADELIWRVRKIKSAFEADLKRTSFAIVDASFNAAIENTKIGVSEIDLYRDLQSRIFLNGADSADPIAMIFGQGSFVYNRMPTLRRLQAGDYIWTDFRSTYGGYPADRNRIARAGDPDPWEIQAYTAVRALTIQLAQSIRPGLPLKHVYAEFERLWNEVALGSAYSMVSRIGHGGGLDVTEPPSIARDSDDVAEPGMILHLEPKLELRGAVFQFEEIVFVKEKGVEFLCEFSPETIPVVR